MFALFFVHRPIAAIVLSILLVMMGGLAITQLPIAGSPEVVPPQIVVSTMYPGANARTVSDTVAAPIEQEVNGVEDMLYMESQCTNDGSMRLTVTFRQGVDIDKAQVLVQNRVSSALPKLPPDASRLVQTRKQSTAIVLVVNILSEDDPITHKPMKDQLFLSNYALTKIKDELARLNGVGDVSMLGQRDYSMRIWLDPNKMANLNMAVGDVTDAIRAQNTQVAAGSIGRPPAPKGQNFESVVNTEGRLTTEEQFKQIVVKYGDKEQLVRLKDVVIDTKPNGEKGVELGAGPMTTPVFSTINLLWDSPSFSSRDRTPSLPPRRSTRRWMNSKRTSLKE